jgi:ERF superfamily
VLQNQIKYGRLVFGGLRKIVSEATSTIKRSEQIGQLVTALALAQTEFTAISKNRVNPHTGSRYADLEGVIAATRPALSKNDLVIIQIPIENNDAKEAGAFSMLAHKSGEFISTELLLPGTMKARDGVLKYDAQSVGSAITYAKRYTWQSLTGVAAEEDDDGNAASGRESSSQNEQEQPRRVPKPPAVNQTPAKTGGARPNQAPNHAPEPPANAQGSAQTSESKAEAPATPPQAVIKADTKEQETALSTAESTTSAPPEQVVGEEKPNKTQFDAYTARAVALKQPLEKAGLKPSKGLQTGAKLKNHLLASAGAKELADLTTGQWEAWLQIFEGLAKTNPAKAVEIIEGGK